MAKAKKIVLQIEVGDKVSLKRGGTIGKVVRVDNTDNATYYYVEYENGNQLCYGKKTMTDLFDI